MATAYPAPSDLRNRFARAGIILDPTAYDDPTLQEYLNQAQGQFETEIGRAMLADSGRTYTELLDCNGRTVLALPNSLARLDALTLRGVALTEGNDFWLYPQRHGSDGLPKPFEWIQFAVSLQDGAYASSRQAVSVTGAWGYNTTTIPELVWNAIIGGACVLLYPEVSGLRTGGAQSVAAGTIREEFSNRADAGAYANEFTQWERQYDKATAQYRRVCVGLGGGR